MPGAFSATFVCDCDLSLKCYIRWCWWPFSYNEQATKHTQIELLKADNHQLREDNIQLVRKVISGIFSLGPSAHGCPTAPTY